MVGVYGVTVVHRNTKGFNPETLWKKDKHYCGSVLQCVKALEQGSRMITPDFAAIKDTHILGIEEGPV
ncbi:unnamed protein product [Fusarium venenatum]|uniref:Uncharacterized protein n=1 Tax=Fusarium venenatum TaxID=56646 RepID=A0A2L2SUD9_9HYPO|nr:uncharacterized protein FVRRES_11846 [Fusarium venenatum]CEI39155.1 unnamed protein product [Fusarium venenatum]